MLLCTVFAFAVLRRLFLFCGACVGFTLAALLRGRCALLCAAFLTALRLSVLNRFPAFLAAALMLALRLGERQCGQKGDHRRPVFYVNMHSYLHIYYGAVRHARRTGKGPDFLRPLEPRF